MFLYIKTEFANFLLLFYIHIRTNMLHIQGRIHKIH